MPSRVLISKELANIFKVVSHPDRIRLIEELGDGERDVNAIAAALELPGARVSQHLSLLRAHRIVEERRDGRHHFYRLSQPRFASWIREGLDFIEGSMAQVDREKIRDARRLWSTASSARHSSK